MRKFPLLRLAVASLAFIPGAGAQQPAVKKMAALKLQVVDSFGGKAEQWEVASFRDRTGREWKTAFEPNGTATVPPGDYTLRIESLVFFPFEAIVSVQPPSSIYMAGLIFAGLENTPPSDDLRGRFESPPGGDAWCKISGLYTKSTYFAAIQSDGRFVFPFVPVGAYVLICRSASETLDSRVIELRVQATPDVVISKPR
jgi:hypothetical protein